MSARWRKARLAATLAARINKVVSSRRDLASSKGSEEVWGAPQPGDMEAQLIEGRAAEDVALDVVLRRAEESVLADESNESKPSPSANPNPDPHHSPIKSKSSNSRKHTKKASSHRSHKSTTSEPEVEVERHVHDEKETDKKKDTNTNTHRPSQRGSFLGLPSGARPSQV